ncbi:MAG: C4-dicarboxylate ABC transporter substrate-binding protein [Alphaproteobacteria bacterium]|nr:MAG: C4-dicarboxylate ABC transporter substrate-binding protein [Alphaproteobacteria bacterium]
MKHFARLAGAVALSLGMSVAALAQEYTLKISSWVPPTHGINALMFKNLIKMMEDATDGRVTGEIVYGLAPPPAQMDLILDGAADITIIFNGYQPGRFVATKLIELPGYEGTAEQASVAYWKVHQKYLAKLNEHRGVKVIALTTHGPGQIHSRIPVKTLADLNGLKTRIGGGVSGDVGAALGLIGINVPAPKVYETLASGAADAVAMPLEGRVGFKLTEVAKNLYMMPGGFYRGAFSVIMNQESFDALPEDIRKALDEKVFGLPASRMMGAAWDEIDRIGLEATKKAADNTITIASDADQAAFAKIAADVRKKVLAELQAAGIDAQAAYEMVRAEMGGS